MAVRTSMAFVYWRLLFLAPSCIIAFYALMTTLVMFLANIFGYTICVVKRCHLCWITASGKHFLRTPWRNFILPSALLVCRLLYILRRGRALKCVTVYNCIWFSAISMYCSDATNASVHGLVMFVIIGCVLSFDNFSKHNLDPDFCDQHLKLESLTKHYY